MQFQKNFILFLSLTVLLSGQSQKKIPTDTSYTIYSAYHKLISEYPFIKIARTEPKEKILANENIVYISKNGRELHLDLFSPEVKSGMRLPCVILIHGGGWRSGNKSMQHAIASRLAANNYVAAAVEYRLSPEAKYPAGVFDLKSAVKWLRKNALMFNIDTSKIAVLGCSAGGTLAALLGATNGDKNFEDTSAYPEFSSEVRGVIDIDGVLDFTDPAESGKDIDSLKPSAGKLFFGCSYKDKPDLWKEASPVNHISGKSAPIIFINSSMERFHAGRDEMIRKLKIFNIYFEVHTIENTPHTFWLFHPWFNRTTELAVQFLNKIFG